MERNHIVGILLIIAVLFLWNQFFFQPEMQEQLKLKTQTDSTQKIQSNTNASQEPIALQTNPVGDSNHLTTATPQVTEQFVVLENPLVQIQISSKGGVIKEAIIKNHQKILSKNEEPERKEALKLLEDSKNIFEYRIKNATQEISTRNLFFEVHQKDPRTVEFIGLLQNGARFIQTYQLSETDYNVDYTLKTEGFQSSDDIVLHWENYLDRLEKNTSYEKFTSSVYFKEKEESPDYCSCRSDDKIESSGKRVNWVSHSNQFYNSTLISELGFSKASYETVMLADDAEDLKKLVTDMTISSNDIRNKEFKMKWYIGPNEFKRLKAYNVSMEDIIPYGWSIFGSINRYAIRPLFVFLANFIGSKGLIILLMTLVVKLLVFPLAYKMLHSQAKMTALKPEIEKVKNKNKDDMQKQQVETMKMYNEFGVNPLGGCFPLILQMPIWIALYRFFPASIEFRQESFLWAADLTSYDEFLHLPFELPLFGNTLSLFAFLWMISTLVFSYYSSQSMDFSSNPAMKYMQYLMPVIFWFMFNKTAAGLTCYMFFSNLLNIAQTILGKRFLFDNEKIRGELELNKTKPRKTGGFRDRLENMMKEQQRIQQERDKKPKK
ncbi:MAG: membrane protein insertase YidC [Saprospiraceae bacterium]|nr:membrane protein insertase YidC [Saprospiraceae bacterium]